MRPREVVAAGVLIVLVASSVSCQLEPMQKVQPQRRQVGLSDVEHAQREVDRTLEQYQRDREAARRSALEGAGG
ncbi:MAG: hypothetical protein MK101_09380 [Phycisphaerales bacterium]|nr:hypothetical protein [Phycisphaerales bacterium]